MLRSSENSVKKSADRPKKRSGRGDIGKITDPRSVLTTTVLFLHRFTEKSVRMKHRQNVVKYTRRLQISRKQINDS